ERVDKEPQLAPSLAKRLSSRARSAPAPVTDRDVNLVSGIERAVADGDDEALEPGAYVPAGLPGQMGDRRGTPRLQAHRGVVGALRIGELRRAPIGREARGDLEPRELVVPVRADLVGDRPGAELPGDDRPGGADRRLPDVLRIGIDRHRSGS